MVRRQKVRNADAAWLHMDRPTNLMIITGVLWFDEPMDWDRLKEVVRLRLLAPYPKFRSRVVEGDIAIAPSHWEEVRDFDAEDHFHHVRLPAPGDEATLHAFVSDVMSRPLDHDRPLWEVYLVDGFGAGSAVVIRLHHCIGDGISLVRVLLSLTDETPDAPTPAVEERHLGDKAPGEGLVGQAVELASEAVRTGIDVIEHPGRIRSFAANAAASVRAAARLLFLPPDRRTVFKGAMGVAKRAAWSRPVSLEEVKEIGRVLGGTLNDVLLTAVAGGLRGYLSERKSLVNDLRAIIPFNLRPLDQPIPPDLGNEFGLVFLDLPVGIGDPWTRLKVLKQRMDGIKSSAEGPVSYAILSGIGVTPLPLEKIIVDVFASKGSAVMTNVPGPAQPIYLAGRRLRGILPWVPKAGNVGLGVSIISYAGEVHLGLATDATRAPDPERIIDAYHAEYEALAALAGLRREAAPPPPADPGDEDEDAAAARRARDGGEEAPRWAAAHGR